MDRRDLFKVGKAVGLGILFGLVTYLISGDGNTSTLLGMLIIYLEYKI